MTRTLIAYGLIALLMGTGIVFGFYLRRNSRERWYRRLRDRERLRGEATATATER